jgi:hypothetical protein
MLIPVNNVTAINIVEWQQRSFSQFPKHLKDNPHAESENGKTLFTPTSEPCKTKVLCIVKVVENIPTIKKAECTITVLQMLVTVFTDSS